MNQFNITDDSTQMLKGAKYPICSFGLYTYFGGRGHGKSTVIQKISDDYI